MGPFQAGLQFELESRLCKCAGGQLYMCSAIILVGHRADDGEAQAALKATPGLGDMESRIANSQSAGLTVEGSFKQRLKKDDPDTSAYAHYSCTSTPVSLTPQVCRPVHFCQAENKEK